MENTADKGRNLYLDLMARVLTGALQEDSDQILGNHRGIGPLRSRVAQTVGAVAGRVGLEIVRKRPYDPALRASGLDRPARAESMIGLARMANVRSCVESVLAQQIPGDLIEAGVWRGGATIFMKAILQAHGVTDRRVWVADSFAGLPPPDAARYPADAGDEHHTLADLRVGVEQVRHNFRRYGLLDDQVRFLVGWFKDTLPGAPIERIAVLRLDGDMYSSTMESLEALYGKLSVGGYCIIDDYGVLPGSRRAVEDFRSAAGIDDPVVDIDGVGVFWRKTCEVGAAPAPARG